MADWAQLTLGVVGIVAAGLALALWLGARAQRRARSRLVDSLVGAAVAPAAARAEPGDRAGLPAPVARYFARVLGSDPRAPIRTARFRQAGKLRTDAMKDRWLAFEANQVVVPPAPGFVWDARVAVAPLLHVRVRDALVGGRGSGQVSLLSAFTVAAAANAPEMDSGALHRYLAEAVWYPSALLPEAGVRWSPIDEDRALATLTDRGTTVSLEFRFDAAGEVIGIYTPARWGRFDGGYRQVPWEGRFRNYVERDGMRVPSEGEVGWHLEGQWRSVWRGALVSARYEFAR